jgi:hypothetical protein
VLVRLLLSVLCLGSALLGLGATSYVLARPFLAARRLRRRGALNAASADEFSCGLCSEFVEAGTLEHVYFRGRWFHGACYRKLLGPLDP